MTERSAWSALEPLSHQLGQVADSELATRAGVPADAVGYHRRRLGIAPYRPPTEIP